MQVQSKIFKGNNQKLEEEMNAWLARHLGIEIVAMTQASDGGGGGSNHMIVILYRLPAPHPHR